ncbi:MAG: acyloxyacyl hydrolase [Balneolaceae bacterium]
MKQLAAILIYAFCFEAVQARQVKPEQNFKPVLGLATSYSPSSFRNWGTMENTQLTLLKVQYMHTEVEVTSLKAHLSSDFIFTGWVYFPIDGQDGPKENRFGIGFTPFRIDIPIGKKNHYPFLTSSAGLLFTDRPFPNEEGARLNFLLDAGIGYAIQLKNNRHLQLGYKLHHLSNGNTGSLNPGIDSHMFFVNFLFEI